MTSRTEVLEGATAAGPVADAALSHALLRAVGDGRRPESLRLWRPGDAMAFSVADRNRSGFARAATAAEGAGFPPFLRLTGGHAAAYTREALAFAWVVPSESPRQGIHERFERLASWVARALGRLGVDARVGPVPGEYCAGDHSVNAGGRAKLMGVGQRVVRGAALLGGVVVVGGGGRARAALTPVYAALGLAFDPETVGSVEQEVPGCAYPDVRDALLGELAGGRELAKGAFDFELLAQAKSLEARHRCDERRGPPMSSGKVAIDL